jgi:hypothetical protein
MTTNRLFCAYINPLAFHKVDEPWASHTDDGDLNLEDILRFMCTPGTTSDLLSLVARYREISAETKRLSVAPEEPNILEKLVWPLRHAKASYMVGNYLGTISLCGMVAEMSAILIFEIADISINAQPLNNKTQEKIFGRTFENLGQDQRVRVLHAMVEGIDDEVKLWFDLIRDKRKRYLHLFSQEHTEIARDARDVFDAAVKIVVRVIGQDFKEGVVLLNPNLIKYLELKGVMEPSGAIESKELEK